MGGEIQKTSRRPGLGQGCLLGGHGGKSREQWHRSRQDGGVGGVQSKGISCEWA